MAKELLVQIWCDVHLRRLEQRVPVDESGVRVIGFGTRGFQRELALCDECADLQLTLAEWEELVREVGAKLDEEPRPNTAPARAARVAAGELFCPIPDCDRHVKPFPSEGALGYHLRRQHDTSLATLGLGNVGVDGRSKALACPAKGCHLVVGGWPGLSAHVRFNHPEQYVAGKGQLRAWYDRESAAREADKAAV